MPRKKRPKLTTRKNNQTEYHRNRAARTRERNAAVSGSPSDENEGPMGGGGSDDDGSIAGCSRQVSISNQLVPSNDIYIQATVDTNDQGVQGDHFATEDCAVQASVETQDQESQATPNSEDCAVQASVETQDQESQATVNTAEKGVPEMELHMSLLEQVGRLLERELSPAAWMVRLVGDHLLIFELSVGEAGCSIQADKVVSCSRDGEIHIFIRNLRLLNNHNIWDVIEDMDLSCEKVLSDALLKLIYKLKDYGVCEGATNVLCASVASLGKFAEKVKKEEGFSKTAVYRSISCPILIKKRICEFCRRAQNDMVRRSKKVMRQEERNIYGINLKYYSREELLNALKDSRLEGTKMRRQVKDLRSRIDRLINKEGQEVDQGMNKDFLKLIKDNKAKMTPLQQLFWEQQFKAASMKNQRSMRWHPMMIKIALQFQMLSSSAKQFLERTGILKFPSNRRLYDFSHATESKEGIKHDVIRNFKDKLDSKCQEGHEKFVNLVFDEMVVKSSLVFKRGNFVGFVNVSDVEQEFKDLESEWTGVKSRKTLAKKVLVYMVKNMTAPDTVKDVVALYPVGDLAASGLHSRTWEVICALESADIPVLVVTCDGASTNRKFISMHLKLSNEESADLLGMTVLEYVKYCGDLIHVTVNMASPNLRPLFFMIDPPHVLKTVRNCWANSGCHKKTRRLWKNGEEILWNLVINHYESHKGEKFRKAHKITAAHVYLTSFSLMNVSFAAQVCSNSLAVAVEQDAHSAIKRGDKFPHYKETVKFMRTFNEFFDCVNGHNPTSGIRYRNDNLAPYISDTDPRFKTLLEVLQYLADWQQDVNNRPGRFSLKQREKMMISHQTIKSLHITILSFIGVVRFLLKEGATSVSGRKMCQDPLEQYFSTIRRKGGSNNNPTVNEALQLSTTLHAQGELALPSLRGNTRFEDRDIPIDSTPLPTRKKPKK